eukprot:COSAG01_NODE_32857_length_574_cov_0.760000_1_plen_96_part_00
MAYPSAAAAAALLGLSRGRRCKPSALCADDRVVVIMMMRSRDITAAAIMRGRPHISQGRVAGHERVIGPPCLAVCTHCDPMKIWQCWKSGGAGGA